MARLQAGIVYAGGHFRPFGNALDAAHVFSRRPIPEPGAMNYALISQGGSPTDPYGRATIVRGFIRSTAPLTVALPGATSVSRGTPAHVAQLAPLAPAARNEVI